MLEQEFQRVWNRRQAFHPGVSHFRQERIGIETISSAGGCDICPRKRRKVVDAVFSLFILAGSAFAIEKPFDRRLQLCRSTGRYNVNSRILRIRDYGLDCSDQSREAGARFVQSV